MVAKEGKLSNVPSGTIFQWSDTRQGANKNQAGLGLASYHSDGLRTHDILKA